MSVPAVIIRLELEGAPRLLVDCLSDREEERLFDWLEAHPELLELVVRALDLQDEARPAA
jgi:hypothetical protein